jgi:putative chitinase
MTISLDQLKACSPLTRPQNLPLYIAPINNTMAVYAINTPLRAAHFLAQIIHESGSLNYSEENLNYSAALLVKVFPHYFPTIDVAMPYNMKPEMIANHIYANRMGNGAESTGDGFKYRGRGVIQITGKQNYATTGAALKVDLVNHPEILKDPHFSLLAAGHYWLSRGLNELADKDDVKNITLRINGGTNGLADRTANLIKCKQVLGVK